MNSRLAFLIKPEAVLFVLIWLTCGALTNRREMRDYDLNAASIDAIVEHGTFELGHSANEHLRTAGGYDSFNFRGSQFRYTARQPGLAVVGAAPYAALHLFGFSMGAHYDLCMAVIAWMTSGLFTATAAVLLCLLLKNWETPAWAAECIALAYAFGTNILPYTGVPHHDVEATALVIAGIWSLDLARRQGKGRWAALAGMFFGMVLFFSLLPGFLVAVLLLYIGATLPIRRSMLAAVAFLAALCPTLAYNWHYFGDPFMTMNRAGNYQDTYLSFSWNGLSGKLNNYFGTGWISARFYEPQVYLGLLGLFLLRGRPWQDRIFLPLSTAVYLFFLFNIGTDGQTQLGPRYLMPILPLSALGLGALFRLEGPRWLIIPLRGVVVLTLLYCIVVNVIGGFGYCCYPSVDKFGPIFFLKHADEIRHDFFPLAWICLSLFAAWIGLLVYLQRQSPRTSA